MSYMGTYDRTIFYNPVNKYCVISVKTNDQSIPQQARSAYKHRDRLIRFVATGYELPQTDKVSMVLEGEWTTGKHGYTVKRLIVCITCLSVILFIAGCALYTVFRADVVFLFQAGALLLAAFVITGTGISVCKAKKEEKSIEGKRDEYEP